MEKLRVLYRYFKEKYDLLNVNKYTTLAGTLVFFLIMSIVPLSFWITLFLGKLPVNQDEILNLPVFEAVKDILFYVRQEAENATASVSVILLFTTAYSSTNLFYQMRRSGEIIYDYHREKQGLRVRLSALILMFIIIFIMILFVALFALGSFLFSRFFPHFFEQLAEYTLLALLSFALVLLLNIYICPFKRPVKSFLKGTCITVVAWAVAIVGFTIYLKISNVKRLYGALSTIIVFLLWLYMLMLGFIAGVIFNSENNKLQRKNRAKKHKSTNRAQTKSMKTIRLKTSFCSVICTLALLLVPVKNDSIKEITKPYLGEYECTQAILGKCDFLKDYDFITLELKSDQTYLLKYAKNGGDPIEETGEYSYDIERQELCIESGKKGFLKRKIPIKNGKIFLSMQMGKQQLLLKFEKK